MVADFNLEISRDGGSFCTGTLIKITGSFSGVGALQERSRFLSLIEECLDQCVLDMSQVNYIDSAALGLIVKCSQSAKKANKQLIILKPQPQVLKTLRLMKLDQILTIYEIWQNFSR